MAGFEITVMPDNKKVAVSEDSKSLRSVLLEAGVHVEGTCNGKGTCGKCKVRILQGEKALAKEAGNKLSLEEKEAGWRLACLIPVEEDMEILLPTRAEEGDRKTGLSGEESYELQTLLQKTYLHLEKPSLTDQRSDVTRIFTELGRVINEVPLSFVRKTPGILRSGKYRVTATVCDDRLIDIEEGDTSEQAYGVAFDIGTTTVVGTLVDLTNGQVVAAQAEANGQRSYGADVIARITYTNEHENGLATLKDKVIETLNTIILALVEKAQIKKSNIYRVTTVGNTVMQHLLVGVDPLHIAMSPYIPVFQNALKIKAFELGIDVHEEAMLYTVPNVAGYVGADTVAVVLATHLEESEKILLAVDIGTNGEIVLGNKDKMVACSTAAGPAFEGSQIKYGMRAADGAIEKVKFEEDVHLEVIGNKKPIGICGSGLVDVVAELVRTGIVGVTGRILPPEELPPMSEPLKKRVVEGANGYDFVLYQGEKESDRILLTQKDVRELQLAKGAIYAGIKILMKELGVTFSDIDRVLLAGAFGNYIQVESAKIISLLPNELIVEQVGNAAGTGSRMALTSDKERKRAEYIAKNMDYLELSSRADFQDEFMSALGF